MGDRSPISANNFDNMYLKDLVERILDSLGSKCTACEEGRRNGTRFQLTVSCYIVRSNAVNVFVTQGLV